MKDLNCIYPFFIVCLVFSYPPLTSTETFLGKAMCHVWGRFKSECKTNDVDVTTFPRCTSIAYNYLDLNSGTVGDMNDGKVAEGYIDSLASTNKPVIAAYIRKNWPAVVKNIHKDPATKEVASWKTYLEKHPVIQGLAISGIEYEVDAVVDNNYTDNLVAYIEIMKTNFPTHKIGLYLNSAQIYNIEGTPQLQCMDMRKIEKCVEFIVVLPTREYDAIKCEDPIYYHGGPVISPVTTTTQMWMAGYSVPPDKVIYDVYITPTNFQLKDCNLLYSSMCKDPNGTYCADTQQDYYDKGVDIKKIGGGFSVRYIDQDDGDSICGCGRSYPAFNAILDGFNGSPAPKVCELFDRPALKDPGS